MDVALVSSRRLVTLRVLVVATVTAAVVSGTVGAVIGRSVLLDHRDARAVIVQAMVAQDGSWLVTVETDEIEGDYDGKLSFDARTVAWVDENQRFRDGLSEDMPPCLRVGEPATVEVTYVPAEGGQAAVLKIRCLEQT